MDSADGDQKQVAESQQDMDAMKDTPATEATTTGDAKKDTATTEDVTADTVTTEEATTEDVTTDDVTTDDVTTDDVTTDDVTKDNTTTETTATEITATKTIASEATGSETTATDTPTKATSATEVTPAETNTTEAPTKDATETETPAKEITAAEPLAKEAPETKGTVTDAASTEANKPETPAKEITGADFPAKEVTVAKTRAKEATAIETLTTETSTLEAETTASESPTAIKAEDSATETSTKEASDTETLDIAVVKTEVDTAPPPPKKRSTRKPSTSETSAAGATAEEDSDFGDGTETREGIDYPVDPLDPNLEATCKLCEGKDFHFYGLLERHRAEAHGMPEAADCKQCTNVFRRRMNLVLHWRSKTHRKAVYIGCDICDAFIITNGFESEEALREHTILVHGEALEINSKSVNGPFTCPFCGSSFVHRKGMIEHLQVIHADHFYGHMLGVTGQEMREMMNRLLIPCPDCPDKFFRVKSTLNRHREKVHNDYLHWANHPNKGHGIPQQAIDALKKLEKEQGSDSEYPAADSLSVKKKKKKGRRGARNSISGDRSLNSSFPVRRTKSLGGTPARPRPSTKDLMAQRKLKVKITPRKSGRKASQKNLSLKEEDLDEDLDGVFAKKVRDGSEVVSSTPQSEAKKQQKTLTELWSKSPDTAGSPNGSSPRKALSGMKLSPGSGQVVCKFCQSTFTRQSILHIHMEMSHKNEEKDASGESTEENGVANGSSKSQNVISAAEWLAKRQNRRPKPVGFNSVMAAAKAAKRRAGLSGGGSAAKRSLLDNHVNEIKDEFADDENMQTNGNSVVEEDQEDPIAKRLREQEEEEAAFQPWLPPAVPRPKEELTEECAFECGRFFATYFSMMRHVAFVHRPEKTMKLMKLKPWDEDEILIRQNRRERKKANLQDAQEPAKIEG